MRGQAHTLEAFMAALLLVAGVLFALQATAVTPLSASTSNQHIQNQQGNVANDLLATAAENDTLREAVVFWNASEAAFVNTSERSYYTDGGPPNAFGRSLDETFRDDRIAFNVYVEHASEDADRSQRMVYMGSPSDNAVSASRTVVLLNGTTTHDGHTLKAIEENGSLSFFASDVQPGGELYNVVEVRIVAWRM